jgi:hypothetical protein
MPSPLVPRDPPKGRVNSVCNSALGRMRSIFYPPSGRVAEEERRSGEGQQDLTTLAEGSAMD